MERYICIHGHFYQPPRENPWLEAIEIQDLAYPYHDWNEKITFECYAPNSASRNLDGDGRILDIESNYSRISFNFGPTLLSWIEKNSPETYQVILDSDRQSIEWRSGHGNAIAQVYNHIIMPLASTRDKRTQIIWGIKDFEYRFKRFPEGMWLSETAVDIETLDILAEVGIKFTILAPNQAWRVRKMGTGKWRDVSGSKIDPTMAYRCSLPSDRTINIFFYDGPISRAVAFEDLLKKGEDFAKRILSGFSDQRQWPQIMHIATDGETYGHHHKFGDMALVHALNYIEANGLERLTNYGEYLEKYPPTHEVQIFENSSWSCIHGIERWRSNCGCNSGGHPGWNQEWRKPLRDALDWLRDRLSFIYENVSGEYLKNPWDARDDYIDIILNRSEENIKRFFERHTSKNLNSDERILVFKLLEIQRHAMLMYTSCGWFFDELSGVETIQVIQYAGRAIQLSEEIFHDRLEDTFKTRLALAKSNVTEYENGALIYEKFVKPAMIDLKKVGAHYAVSSLFEDYIDETTIYSYVVTKEDYQKIQAGSTKLAIGRISVFSKITEESERISFCVLHFGGHALNGGVRSFLGHEAYQSMKDEIISTFEIGAFANIVRLIDNHFGMHNYSLINLFRDQQRNILNFLISKTLEDFEDTYRNLYENNRILMGFLRETGMPVKKAFYSAAEVTLNSDIKKAFLEEVTDVGRIQNLFNDMKRWDVLLDSIDIEFIVRRKLEGLMEKLYTNPSDLVLLLEIQKVLELLKLLPIEINYWQTRNIYYKMAKTTYREFLLKTRAGNEDAVRWVDTFKYLGEMLFFNISSVLPGE
jgi:alpha-amylase/alpha-mannosidase (GH57 family)